MTTSREALLKRLGNPEKGSLHWAALQDDLAGAIELIRNGADVNAQTKEGVTPLDVAREFEHGVVYQLLKISGGVPGEEAGFDRGLGLVDLASAQLGSKIIWTNNEWFAAASNLLKPGRGSFSPQTFVSTGQLYDGWETARHGALRRGGRDFCYIQLGVPGVVKGFDIDTNHFTGNYAPAASVDGYCADRELSTEELNVVEWTEILPEVTLSASSQHYFAAALVSRWTHLRLNIYPDGGVARFRAFGDVTPKWNDEKEEEMIDLALITHGGKGVFVSDSYFSHPDNAITPGRGINMGDGWETKRSRSPDHKEWLVIRLGRLGSIEEIELDTNHFKGNYPWGVVVDGCFGEGGEWREMLPLTHLEGHKQQTFVRTTDSQATESIATLRDVGLVSHVRVTIIPDGGISRIRLRGKPFSRKSLTREMLSTSLTSHIQLLGIDEGRFHTFGSVSQVLTDEGCKQWLASTTGTMSVMCKQGIALPHGMVQLQQNFEGECTYVPLGGVAKYLVVVALPKIRGTRPDLMNLSGFINEGNRAVHIHQGVWHYIAPLDQVGQFLVIESGQKRWSQISPNNILLK